MIYRQDHDIWIHTLISNQPSFLEKSHLFDCWIQREGQFDQQSLDYRIHATFDQIQIDNKRKQTNDKKEMKRPIRRNCLVIQDQSVQNTVMFDMIGVGKDLRY